jgi:chemotaxis methyl-accepting protein methylase
MSNEQKIKEVLSLIYQYGGIDGSHHKQWLLNKILETLLEGEEYNEFITEYCDGEDGPNTYFWDKGIAP